MDRPNLGRLEKVDLRTCWQREDTDFTPWLATSENIALLAETLGFTELAVEETEANVGPFRADVLCRDVGSEGYVLIENQLERTDHSHLGQLLTYAAGLEAASIVWIAAGFAEEHRAALDWLNRHTHEGINFFGVQVELWRIGDSPMAPRFHVVVMPNDWTKRVATATKGGRHAAHHEDYLAFWQGFAAYVNKHVPQLPPPKPAARNWIDVGPPLPGVRVTVSYSAREKQTRLYVLVRNEDEPERYSFLEGRADLIAQKTGQKLSWHPQPSRGGGWFGWAEPPSEDEIRGTDAHYAWPAKRLVPIIEVLQELLEELDSR